MKNTYAILLQHRLISAMKISSPDSIGIFLFVLTLPLLRGVITLNLARSITSQPLSPATTLKLICVRKQYGLRTLNGLQQF